MHVFSGKERSGCRRFEPEPESFYACSLNRLGGTLERHRTECVLPVLHIYQYAMATLLRLDVGARWKAARNPVS
jgi:hypothetical protein